MSRVNFGARQEYEYLNNFKVLQKTFKDHKVDKVRAVRPASCLLVVLESHKGCAVADSSAANALWTAIPATAASY
jgi:hypothetical protein